MIEGEKTDEEGGESDRGEDRGDIKTDGLRQVNDRIGSTILSLK